MSRETRYTAAQMALLYPGLCATKEEMISLMLGIRYGPELFMRHPETWLAIKEAMKVEFDIVDVAPAVDEIHSKMRPAKSG